MSDSTPLIIVTGPPGAGKSTASEGVAAQFNPAAVVAGDAFFDFLRQGRIAPWEAEAHDPAEQAEMRANVAAQMHQSFAEATDYASHVIDTTSISPQDGVRAIIAGLDEGRFRLQR